MSIVIEISSWQQCSKQVYLLMFCSFCCSRCLSQYLYVAMAVLKLAMKTKLDLNSQRSSCLSLPSAGIKGKCYHTHFCSFLEINIDIIFLNYIFKGQFDGIQLGNMILMAQYLEHLFVMPVGVRGRDFLSL